MKTIKAAAVVVFTMTLLLLGCVGDSGEQYLGKWVSVTNKRNTLDIERNGEAFMIRHPAAFSKRIENIPASLENGVLKISVGFGSVSLAIDEKTGLLTDGRMEYKRVE